MPTTSVSSATVTTGTVWQYRKTETFGDSTVTTQDDNNKTVSRGFTNGTGNNQVNRVWRAQVSVTAAAPYDIDLQGALTDCFGDTLTFRRIKSILVSNESTTHADYIDVGPLSQANPFDDPWGNQAAGFNRVPGEGVLALVAPRAGWDVGVTQQNFRIRHSGQNASINVCVVLMGVAGAVDTEESSSSSESSYSSSSVTSSSSSTSSLSMSSESSASESSESPSSSSMSQTSSSSSLSSASSLSQTSMSESSKSDI